MCARQLRAPAEDGAILAAPALDQVGALCLANRRIFASGEAEGLGQTWATLRSAAGQEILAAARDYLESAGEPVSEGCKGQSIFLTGHQPELFHPGVWLKNFVLNQLAREHGAWPIHLIVDNDTVKSTSLRMPIISVDDAEPAKTQLFDFDRWIGEVPYEECSIADLEYFSTFPERLTPVSKAWGFEPILGEFWQEIRRQTSRSRRLGECFAAARRTWERRWGCHNLELPLSSVCGTASFAKFFCHLLRDLPRFHEVHNACLGEYRRRYGIRSRAHPVPDLMVQGEWYEAPFWAWRPGLARRSRLLARAAGSMVEMRFERDAAAATTIHPADAWQEGRAFWARLEKQGIRVRSRALTTTMFARLFFGDLFIHGIGGAKYDELTDAIVRDFFGLEPPAFVVLSGTLHLPFRTTPVDRGRIARLANEVRDFHCNPQRHLSEANGQGSAAHELATRKQAWIEQRPSNGLARQARYRMLKDLTAQLRSYVAKPERERRAALLEARRELRTNAVILRRDYAFCLFPETKLRPFCSQFFGRC
jgi:hypothetical protein